MPCGDQSADTDSYAGKPRRQAQAGGVAMQPAAHTPQPIPDDGGPPAAPPARPARPQPIDPPDDSPPMELPPSELPPA